MTYLALARKWRPKTFAEVVGQQHVVQALSNALISGRIHHAFLFTGTRGVGKTTLARIFAKSLNCEQGTSAEPCQQCDVCQSIDEGRYVDLIEVDAASRTKVDDTRELLENVQYAPTQGKYKVYLIDEVHMLSGHSFNALLKTLEEPPEHVKFLFATTDPQKLPVTVLSRCLQFNLRAMRPEQIENQLTKILQQEDIQYQQAALKAIAKAADGSMRDGLSLLDQAIAQGGGAVHADNVEAMLGTIKTEHSDALLNALATQNADQIMQIVNDMADHAVDFVSAMDALLEHLYHISLAQIAPAALAAKNIDSSLITELASQVDAETVQLYYQIGLLAKRDIGLAPNLRVGFEMALLRMLAFEPDNNDSSGRLSKRSNNDIQTTPTGIDSSLPDAQKMSPSQLGEIEPISSLHAENVEQLPIHSTTRILPAANEVDEANKKNNVKQIQPTNRSKVTMAGGNNEWGELIEQSSLTGLSKQLAMNCACEKRTDEVIQLSLSAKNEHLFKEDRLADIESNIQQLIHSTVKIELLVEDSNIETPAECLQRLSHEKFEHTKKNLENDPGVKALMSEFGATINEQSIKPN